MNKNMNKERNEMMERRNNGHEMKGTKNERTECRKEGRKEEADEGRIFVRGK